MKHTLGALEMVAEMRQMIVDKGLTSRDKDFCDWFNSTAWLMSDNGWTEPVLCRQVHLRAAAPDMFAALQLTTALLNEYPTVKSIVLQALAKAEGVEP